MAANSVQMLRTIGSGLWRAAFVLFCVLPLFGFSQKTPSVELQLQKCWEYRYTGEAGPQIVSDPDAVFIRRESSSVDAVGADGGKLVWTSDVGGSIDSNLLVAGGNLVLVRKAADPATPPSLVALSSATGITKWATPLPPGQDFFLAASGGSIVVISQSGSIAGVDAHDGAIVWSHQTTSGILLPTVVAGSDLLFAFNDRNVGTISPGGIVSPGLSPFPFALTSIVRSGDGDIVTGDERGQITAYAPLFKKTEWQFTSGAAVSSLVAADGLILAASNDNFIYALSPGSGRRIWKKRVSGRVESMRMVGTDAIAVQTIGESAVQVLYLKTGKTVGQIALPGGEVPVSLTTVSPRTVSVLSNGALYMFGTAGCQAK